MKSKRILFVLFACSIAILLGTSTALTGQDIKVFDKKVNFNERLLKYSGETYGLKFVVNEKIIEVYYESPEGYTKAYEYKLVDQLYDYEAGSIGNIDKGLIGIADSSIIIIDGSQKKTYEFHFTPVEGRKDKKIKINKYSNTLIKMGDVDSDGKNEIVVSEVRESLARGEIVRMNIVVYKLTDDYKLVGFADKKLKYSNVGSLDIIKKPRSIIVIEEGQETEGGTISGYVINKQTKNVDIVFSKNTSPNHKRAKLIVPSNREKQDLIVADNSGDIRRYILRKDELVQIGKTISIPTKVSKIYKIIDLAKYTTQMSGIVFQTDVGSYIMADD